LHMSKKKKGKGFSRRDGASLFKTKEKIGALGGKTFVIGHHKKTALASIKSLGKKKKEEAKEKRGQVLALWARPFSTRPLLNLFDLSQ